MKLFLSIALLFTLCVFASAQSAQADRTAKAEVLARIVSRPLPLPTPHVESADYFTLTSNDPSGQLFTQFDQFSGIAYPAYAGLLYTATASTQGNEFGAIFRIRLTNQLKVNLPSGHLDGYAVGLYGEARTTAGTATDFDVDGGNFVAESNTLHTGRTYALEANINQGSQSPTTNFTAPTGASPDTRLSAGINITSGGANQPQYALFIDATSTSSPNNRFIRAIGIPFKSFTNRAIDIEDSADPVPPSLSGLVLVRGVNGANGSAITVVAATPSGPSNSFAFSLAKSDSSALLASLSLAGVWNLSGTVAPQFKISSPTTNTGISVARTGGGATLQINTDGFATGVPSMYTSSASDMAFGVNNSEKLRIVNGSNSIRLGMAVNVEWGAGAPSGACSAGIYLRTDMGAGVPGLYVCQDSVWVVK